MFVTPTCPYCPRAAIAGGRIALESPKVKTSVIEASEFPHLAQKYGVMGVPKVVISDAVEFVGALPEIAFVQYLLSTQERISSG